MGTGDVHGARVVGATADVEVSRHGSMGGATIEGADAEGQRSRESSRRLIGGRLVGGRLRLAGAERDALAWWSLTRLATLWIAAQAVWLVGDNATLPGYLERWNRWDARVFSLIAQYGYSGPPDSPGQYEAFFPGLPLAIRAVHLVVPSWTASGLLVSFVAGGVAVVALIRIAALDFGPAVGRRAAMALSLSPLTGFLTAGYSEGLFMAFAFTSWLSARRGRWLAAGLLASGASAVRISGLFLTAALAVEFAITWCRRRRGAVPATGTSSMPRLGSGPHLGSVVWLALPALPVLAFFAYLHARTGRWDAYFVAEDIGWGRHYVGVIETFKLVWAGATTPADHAAWAFGYRVEIISMLVGVVLTLTLAWFRRWAEAIFVAIPIISLAPMATYSSAARTSLTWWPLWIGLAVLAGHARLGPLLSRLYVVLSVPTAVLLLSAFTLWHWAG